MMGFLICVHYILMDDAMESSYAFQEVEYHTWFDVTDGVQAMFTDAGHIIGSTCVNIKVKEDGKETRISLSVVMWVVTGMTF